MGKAVEGTSGEGGVCGMVGEVNFSTSILDRLMKVGG